MGHCWYILSNVTCFNKVWKLPIPPSLSKWNSRDVLSKILFLNPSEGHTRNGYLCTIKWLWNYIITSRIALQEPALSTGLQSVNNIQQEKDYTRCYYVLALIKILLLWWCHGQLESGYISSLWNRHFSKTDDYSRLPQCLERDGEKTSHVSIV